MPDVVPDAGERVAGEVEAVLPVAVDVEEGHDDRRVDAGVAGFPERALVLVPAPEDGELAGLPRGGGRAGEQAVHGENRGDDQEEGGGTTPACQRHF